MSSNAHHPGPEPGTGPASDDQPSTPLQPARTDLRRRMTDAAAMVAATVVLAVLGSAIFAIAYGVPIWVLFSPTFLASLGWKVPLWMLAVAAIAATPRPVSPKGRAALATAAAAVAAAVAILLEFAPYLSTMGGGLMFLAVRSVIDILWFTVCAGIGSFTAVALTGRSWRIPTWQRLSVLAVPLLAVAGGALILALFMQWLSVYFTLWNTEPVVTEAHGIRYLWTAGGAVALLLAAVVLSAMRSKRSMKVLTGSMLAVALLASLLFAVPGDRWLPPNPDPAPADDDYVPCFGEGDPNCVGG